MTSSMHSIEIEIRFSGTVVPGRPETPPAYDHGGLPEEPCTVEDIEITDIGALTYRGASKWDFETLLTGVDKNSPVYKQIEANILILIREDAERNLISEASE